MLNNIFKILNQYFKNIEPIFFSHLFRCQRPAAAEHVVACRAGGTWKRRRVVERQVVRDRAGGGSTQSSLAAGAGERMLGDRIERKLELEWI